MTERFNDTSVDMQIIQTNFITFYTFLPSALPHHSDMYGRLFAKNLLHAIFLFFAHTKKRWWNPLDLTTIELYFWRSPHFWTLPILNVRFLSLISSWKNIVDENRSPFSWAHIASTRFSVPEGCNMVRGSWSQASPLYELPICFCLSFSYRFPIYKRIGFETKLFRDKAIEICTPCWESSVEIVGHTTAELLIA